MNFCSNFQNISFPKKQSGPQFQKKSNISVWWIYFLLHECLVQVGPSQISLFSLVNMQQGNLC